MFFGEDARFHLAAIRRARGFRQADFEHLRGIVPLVDRRGNIKAFIALQADQRPVERLGQNLGHLRLADARIPFEKERTLQLERKEEHRRERARGEIVVAFEKAGGLVDGLRQRPRSHAGHKLWSLLIS